MSYKLTDLDPESRDAVLDALNATYAAMERHGIPRTGVKGETLNEHLDNIIAALHRKLETMSK